MVKYWDFLAEFCDESFVVDLKRCGFEKPTKVQKKSIIPLMNNKDVKVVATTGSGKTLAFVIPTILILKNLKKLKKYSIYALILSPTRELAHQTCQVFTKIAPDMRIGLVLGGDTRTNDVENLRKGLNIVIATPGIIWDLLAGTNYVTDTGCYLASALKYLEILILDEFDRLLDMGFQQQFLICHRISVILSFLPKIRRTGLFSASDSEQIDDLSMKILRNPVVIEIKESEDDPKSMGTCLPLTLQSFYLICESKAKFSYLCQFLQDNSNLKIIVFFATSFMADYFGSIVQKFVKNLNVYIIYGKLGKKRTQVFEEFKNNLQPCALFCSDLVSRGADFPKIDWVIQYEPPRISNVFVHRSGRTARIGETGNSLTLLYPHEINYVDFIKINKNIILQSLVDFKAPTENLYSKVKKLASREREIYIKGLKAFTSFINFYIQHECKNIFSLKEMNIGDVANDFGLLHLPIMPELVGTNSKTFEKIDIDHTNIKFKDKKKEKLRKKILKNKTKCSSM